MITARNRSTIVHPNLRIVELGFPKVPIRNKPIRSLFEIPQLINYATCVCAGSGVVLMP